MKENNMIKIGSVCAIIAGILYLLITVVWFILPPSQRPGGGYSEQVFFESASSQGFALLVWEWWFMALTGFMGIGVVLAMYDYMRSVNEGLMRYVSVIAVAGFTVLSLNFLLYQYHVPNLLSNYASLDDSGKAVIQLIGTGNFDPEAWWGWGFPGLWLFIVNFYALKKGTFSKILAYVGIAGGLAYSCLVLGRLVNSATLVGVAAGLGAITGPIWYIGIGLVLRKQLQSAN